MEIAFNASESAADENLMTSFFPAKYDGSASSQVSAIDSSKSGHGGRRRSVDFLALRGRNARPRSLLLGSSRSAASRSRKATDAFLSLCRASRLATHGAPVIRCSKQAYGRSG